jgi:hypothetical protein
VFIIFIDLERENVAKAGRLASTQPPQPQPLFLHPMKA